MTEGAPQPGVPQPQSLEVLRRAAALVYVEDPEHPELDTESSHHLLDVLRLRPGEEVVAADGSGSWVVCTVGQVPTARKGRRGSGAELVGLLEPTGAMRTEPVNDKPLCVGFALSKGERSEWTIQKLTEIGIDRIVPLLTERTVVRLDGSDALRRAERFGRIAREAAAQSRRPYLPVLEVPVTLGAFVASLGERAAGLAMAEPGGVALDGSVHTLLVGPEGGWSTAELDRVERKVGLGTTVLRAETAALVGATLLAAARSESS